MRRRKSPAPVFAALGDTTRLELLSRLGDGQSHSITELTEGFDLTRQAVTKHLRVLDKAGVVKCKRVGRETRYYIRPGSVSGARDYLMRVSEQWDKTIERLRTVLDE